MYPPVYSTLEASADVVALLGSASRLRVFVPGEAPQETKLSYLVWQTIGGVPENYIGTLPDLDTFAVQLDAYAATLGEARAIAKVVRDAIEPVAYITGWLGEGKDVDTRLYRVSFQVDWITNRSAN